MGWQINGQYEIGKEKKSGQAVLDLRLPMKRGATHIIPRAVCDR